MQSKVHAVHPSASTFFRLSPDALHLKVHASSSLVTNTFDASQVHPSALHLHKVTRPTSKCIQSACEVHVT